MGFQFTKVVHVFTLLCVINLLNYLDRGIIPGAPIEFQGFIQETHHVASNRVSFYIGLLQSSFIASYSIFICIFGYLSMTRKPFQLSAIGLFIWVLSIVLCGLAKPLESFWVLLVGRLISGIGESSFQATTPPFIDEFAPKEKRTLWLGIFYAAVSVGQALGFSYGSVMASNVGWDIGYYITAAIMAPLAFACMKFIPDNLNQPLGNKAPKDMNDDDFLPANEVLPIEEPEPEDKPKSVIHETFTILKSPLFLTSTLGLAAYTFTLNGMVSFAPAILIGYGLLDESIASTVFGALVVVAGLVGSPCGGYAIDLLCRKNPTDRNFRMQRSALFMFVFMTAGVALLFVSLAFMNSTALFFVFLFLGLLLVFSTQTATTIVVLMSVTRSQRGYAMGLNTLLLHLFGDVPAALVLGALKDMWAPNCGSNVDPITHEAVLDPNCHLDKDGLRNTLAFAYGWLIWAVVLWGASYFFACRHVKQAAANNDKSDLELQKSPVHAIFVLLCAINLLNYIDRGIIPGAPIEFQAFVQTTHNVESSNVSVYIGLLQSCFIASYSIFICIFGYMSMTRQPFQLAAIGLAVWIVSIILCGVAKPAESFYLLLFGRLLSGIGESSFHATAPPFIDEFAPPAKRTLWMGIFFAAVSVGQAIGFSYGSVTARSIGWDIGYYITAALMVPLAIICYWGIPNKWNLPLASVSSETHDAYDDDGGSANRSFLHETWQLLRSPIFMCCAMGLAAYTFTIQGMVSFAPAILIGYGLLGESVASTVFGGLVVVAGLIGAPCGGLVLDRMSRGRENDKLHRLKCAALLMFVLMATGVALLFVSLAFMNSKIPFFVFLFLGLLCVFSTQTATTIAILMSVTRSQRGYSMGLNTLLLHLFGDVPAAVILGALKDMWAPNCGSSVDPITHKDVLDPNCYLDKDGLRYTLSFAYGWLLWCVFLWGAAYWIARKHYREVQLQMDDIEFQKTPVAID
ncbi:Major Facilitator Superfamily (MFS) [Achlya hypogyna]|uniref:Major Facilitator Superfamily (MFS) n=1 Tax=Achlya hypogyna TaxID=1202772 RepID=A0A1V9Y4F8_ACHHY|nr:Major Facilitator Superfamily (MFS) [Achlya hypogyna]